MDRTFVNDVEFNKLLAGVDGVDLVRLMLEFAADAYPRLDPAACLNELDRLGHAARERFALHDLRQHDRYGQLSVLSRWLYNDEGFRGNDDDYYDPANSYLNEVLKRRRGIPISLAIVYQSVAAVAGVPMYGVALPAHFMLGCAVQDRVWYVDAFGGGEVLSREACIRRIESRGDLAEPIRPEHFQPADAQTVAARLLRNLKAAHVMRNEWLAALPIQQRLARLLPAARDEQRDLGLIYLRIGQAIEALRHLDLYAQDCSDEDQQAIQPYLRSARRMLAELN